MRYIFNKVGSDPELLFAILKDWMPIVQPAHMILSTDKAVGTTSFIGIDNHPATAELRPPPSHNVYEHLRHIAYGIDQIGAFLTRKKMRDMVIMALPWVAEEALGGHSHVSLFFDEPATQRALKLNYVYHGGMLRRYTKKEPMVDLNELSTSDHNLLNEYAKQAAIGLATTPEVVCHALNYLGLPFEYWMQPWTERAKRFEWCKTAQHYNAEAEGNGDNANYLVRWVCSPRPARYPDLGYLHVEYRTPSTWLMHPALAYVYLAASKLTMLNYELVRGLMMGTKPAEESGEDNQIFRDLFEERLMKAEEKGLRATPDVRALLKTAKYCATQREKWYSSRARGVDVEAWRSLL